MKHNHPRLPAWKNDARVGLYGVQATKISPFGKGYKSMNPRTFCTSQMCVHLERLLQKITNGEGFCRGLAVRVAGARLNREVFAVSH
jgi:hypothetical protein